MKPSNMSSLQIRLQDPDYINWVKAGLCLIHTKSGLEEFAEAASQSLHQSILNNIIPTFASAAQPVCGVNIARQKLIAMCAHPYCQNFITEVTSIGFDPNHAFTVNHWNLGNCDTAQWHSHHWQVAKLFMNRGQEPTHVNPSETDMSGIINFLAHCKVPRNAVTNVSLFDKVRTARNCTMHSAVMKLSAGDLQKHAQSMIDLLSDPGVACFTTAQDAVTAIQTITNAADFKITLEDERKLIDDLAAEMRTQTEGIRQEVDAVARKGDAERQSIKEKIDEEIRKVSALEEKVETIASTQRQMQDNVTILTEILKTLRASEIKLNDMLTDEDKARLRSYLHNIYKNSEYSKVTPLPDWVGLHVRDIFTPVILVGNRKADKNRRLESYNELFHKEGVKQKKIMLLGEAGAGKTTFCHHLIDVWCNPSSKRQFDDVDIICQYQFLFYVCCRFADKNQSVLEMVKSQLFGNDDEFSCIAYNVLSHNADSCLILMDGFDELQRSAAAKTGQHGDITGLPSFSGTQNCVVVVTSRPWKFFSIPKQEQEKFNCLELDGIKDVAELVKTILQDQVQDPAKTCTDVLDEIDKRDLSELMKFPIMLIFAIDVWIENGSLPKSVSRCYISMIDLAISRSARKREEANTDNTAVDKFLDKFSEFAKCQLNSFSHFALMRHHAGLLLSLGRLACDLLFHSDEQTLVFQRNICERYNLNDFDGSLKYCLDLGLLIKIESTMMGKKQKEKFQFCHKTYQEFFAALWLASRYTQEGSQELLHIQSCINNAEDLFNNRVLIQFLCGLCPEAGAELWKYVAQNDNIVRNVQDLILRTVKEAQDCCDHQGDKAYYCISDVIIDKSTVTTYEDVSLLCKMIQNNSSYLRYLNVVDMCLSSFQYHSLLRSASSAIKLYVLELDNISCQSSDSSEQLPELDLNKHHKLLELKLDNIPINGLLLPTQQASLLSNVYLDNLVLSQENLVHLCSSLQSVTGIRDLRLTNILCSNGGDGCCLAVLKLHNHHLLQKLILNKISIRGLLLPSQEESQLQEMHLHNLMLSHDNMVQFCSSLSPVIRLGWLSLVNLSCSEHRYDCCPAVLDLHNNRGLWELTLDKITINGLLLPSQVKSRLGYLYLYIHNLMISHDSLVQCCSSLSSVTGIIDLILTNLSCSEHRDGCCPAVLDLHNDRGPWKLSLDTISISGLLIPSQEMSWLSRLYLDKLMISHDSLVQICSSLSYGKGLAYLRLNYLSCIEHRDDCCPAVLDLRNISELFVLALDKVSISGLLLPSVEGSLLMHLFLDKLSLDLEQFCSSLPRVTEIRELGLVNLSCTEHKHDCCPAVLDLHNNDELLQLTLDKISLSGLLLPSLEGSLLMNLFLNNLMLSHDNLVRLCSAISSLSSIRILQITQVCCSNHGGCRGVLISDLPNPDSDNTVKTQIPDTNWSSLSGLDELKLQIMPCRELIGTCKFTLLDLHKHRRLKTLKLEMSSISGVRLPRKEQIEIEDLVLSNLVLSHRSLEQLPRSLSFLSGSVELNLVNLSCSDHGGSCEFPSLNHPNIELQTMDSDEIS